MTETVPRNLTLPFIFETSSQNRGISSSAELASTVCLAESQRKRAGLLRDRPEKITSVSKVSYPIWAIQNGNMSVLIDGIKNNEFNFSFDEPNALITIIEELKRNSTNLQQFLQVIEIQKKTATTNSTQKSFNFPGLIVDKEMLIFLQDYLRKGHLTETEDSSTLPPELDLDGASQIGDNLSVCIRTLNANAKGLQNALSVLEEEKMELTNSAKNEIAFLQEKCESQTNEIRPSVEKNTKRITQKSEKALQTLQKRAEKRIAIIEKQRENQMHKLQIAEQKKDALIARREAAKKRTAKSSAGSYAIKKYDQEIDRIKKQIAEITKQLEKTRKETSETIKQREAEFQNAIVQEEFRITYIEKKYQEKIDARQNQINILNNQSAEVSAILENQIKAINRQTSELNETISLNWTPENADSPILIQLPIYIIKYAKGHEEERYNIVTPIAFSQEASVLNGLKKMFSLNPEPRLMAITHSANKQLQETLSNQISEMVQKDASFRSKLESVCKNTNLIDQDTFPQTLNEGLDEIEKLGFMTSEEASGLCKRIMEEIS